MRWLRGLAALAALALVIAGAPAALLSWGRLPAGWSILARPDDGSLLLAALTAAGWLAWAAFAASTAVEAVRLVGRSHRRLRIPLLGGLQQLSAGLLLAILALAPSAPHPPGPGPAIIAAAEPEPHSGRSAAETVAAGASATTADEQGPAYVVESGDDLWTIAEAALGDGSRWRDLVASNPEHLHDPTARLAAGTRLVLPSAEVRARHVTVRRGDTLSGLALEHLGAAERWPRIAEANRDLIDDPDHIEVGWRLAIPGMAATTHRATPERVHDRSDSASEHHEHHEQTTPAAAPPATTAESPSSPDPAAVGEETLTPPVEPPDPAAAAEQPPALPLLGTLAAAAIIGVVETRRFLRLRERPVGRRLITPAEDAARLRSALRAQQSPDRLAVLDAALRAIGRHCHDAGCPLPELERITIDPSVISFDWLAPAGPPPSGFGGTDERWTVSLAAPPSADGHPCSYPAVVSLGTTAAGALVLVDAERSRVLAVSADDPELRRSALAAMAVELACAPWSAEARLVVAGEDADLVVLAGGDRVQARASTGDAVAHLRLVVAERRRALRGEPLAALRVHPDRADAVASLVFCFLDDVTPVLATELDGLLAGPGVGVAVVLGTRSAAGAQWQVGGDVHAPQGTLTGTPGRLLAHAIPEATRAGVASLFRVADDPATTPAPWWGGDEPAGAHGNVRALPPRARRGEDPVDIVQLVPVEHPQVLLIGPADLRGAPGPEPSRSRQQLVELCAWLLEHPGSTATAMASGLAVAEGTRRSNVSRLRAWLGRAPDGSAYLPDAYSGRVLLHPGITSDWHRLQLLLSPGIDRVGESTLVAALELVRGAPLADAAPGQWHWAEELRTDVSCALRDVGLVLTDRALARGDIDLARWAAARALVVAPQDEQLLCARIRTEHRAGNAGEVERLVNQVTRQARILEVDLLPETVDLCQQVIEGRVRARA